MAQPPLCHPGCYALSDDSGDRDLPEPPSGNPSPNRHLRLHAVLRRHRLSAVAIGAVAQIGEALRQRTMATGTEWSAMVDVATGAQVGPTLAGGEDYVDADEQLDALDWRGQYVAIHTHPESTSFSEADARVLVSNAPLRTVVAVGLDGGWYVLSKVPSGPVPSAVAVRIVFRREVRALVPDYRERVQAGEMDPIEAWRHHSHEVWQTIAPTLGLRYDRVVVD